MPLTKIFQKLRYWSNLDGLEVLWLFSVVRIDFNAETNEDVVVVDET